MIIYLPCLFKKLPCFWNLPCLRKNAMDVKLAIMQQMQFAMARKLTLQNKCKNCHLNEADRTVFIMQMKFSKKKLPFELTKLFYDLPWCYFYNGKFYKILISKKKAWQKYSSNISDNAHIAIFRNCHGKNLCSEIDMAKITMEKKIEWTVETKKIVMADSY